MNIKLFVKTTSSSSMMSLLFVFQNYFVVNQRLKMLLPSFLPSFICFLHLLPFFLPHLHTFIRRPVKRWVTDQSRQGFHRTLRVQDNEGSLLVLGVRVAEVEARDDFVEPEQRLFTHTHV